MKNIYFLCALFFAFACQQEQKPETTIQPWVAYDESKELAENADHESDKMRFRLIQSRISDKNKLWEDIGDQIKFFSEEDYQALSSLILEQSIPTIQNHIEKGDLTYEKLTQWYLYRIVKYENDSGKYLNNIIAINPNAVKEAQKKDKDRSGQEHPLYGMPVLLKDNVNFGGVPTSAGTHLLRNNMAEDAFIVDRIQEKGGIILGKTNLSEWANYLCLDCPNGYSAVGGQTLNPYGRKVFDTGGSSSGSGSSIAANYAVAAIGTETSGSILSPSSSNAIVGLKPTTGLLSRDGIVPLSSTLDTPGPMTKSVIDNAILLSALTGEDQNDSATLGSPTDVTYWEDLASGSLAGVRVGVNKSFIDDSIYRENVDKIVTLGATAIEFDPKQIDFDGFGELLNADMKIDLPKYLEKYANEEIAIRSVAEIVNYNQTDSLDKIPYGQGRFAGILDTDLSKEELIQLRARLRKEGVSFFEEAMSEHELDFVLSINNWNAGHAAMANYPCITVPMGYRADGQPVGVTFISRPFEEEKLLRVGYAFEQATKVRRLPQDYQ
ncbi:MAG: amidase family protein [Tunicatimonas sp.]|uniref:amidase family protein n=1 Tax=Tunicatimonas sp. TaxID=1940096 RepID=UPI003C7521A5